MSYQRALCESEEWLKSLWLTQDFPENLRASGAPRWAITKVVITVRHLTARRMTPAAGRRTGFTSTCITLVPVVKELDASLPYARRVRWWALGIEIAAHFLPAVPKVVTVALWLRRPGERFSYRCEEIHHRQQQRRNQHHSQDAHDYAVHFSTLQHFCHLLSISKSHCAFLRHSR